MATGDGLVDAPQPSLDEILGDALSFDSVMTLAVSWLYDAGYTPFKRGDEFFVQYPGLPGMPLKFSAALAIETDSWYQKKMAELSAK
jgi:hypothetical protein